MKNRKPYSFLQNKSKNQVKIALILPGSVTDQSWNFVGYQGLRAAEAELGVMVDYSESVKPENYESSFRKYAESGFDLVIGHGSEFGDAAVKVAEEFPDIYFAVVNSSVKGRNLAGLDTRNEEMGYVAGYISGMLSKTKVVAFIGATRILAMVRAEQGFHLGVKAACPDCQVLVEYIGSFDNEMMGRNTALALINRGVDIIFNNDDAAGLGALRVAEEKGILAIGSDYDQKPVAPKALLTSVLAHVTPMIVSIVKEVIDGNFMPDMVRMNGFATGVYGLTPINPNCISEEKAEIISGVIARLIAGEIVLPHIKSSIPPRLQNE